MKKFPQKTVTRTLLYVRTLDNLLEQGKKFVSSWELAEITDLTDVQTRKDISNFGRVGRPRLGYEIRKLKSILEEYVLQHTVHVVLFGVGNLGSAIIRYPGFHNEKIKMVAAFDVDKKKVGKKIRDVKIYSFDEATKVVPKTHAEIGIIAVPAEHSQETADIIVASGLRGIVNFTPTTINVPKDVFVKNIDLSIEFLSLFCDIQRT